VYSARNEMHDLLMYLYTRKTGRHPCAGMRLAKLEIKIILALVLLGLDYELVDSSGNYPTNIPIPDRNGIQQVNINA